MSHQSTRNRIIDLTPFIILGVLILSIGSVWLYVIQPHLTYMKESSNIRYEKLEAEENIIKENIKNNLITCEYVSNERMKYAGDPFINALDDSFIKSKLMTYWNTHNCGVEWEWWD